MVSMATFLALTLLAKQTSADICSGVDASPDWYGAVGHPPSLIQSSVEKCPQKYGLSRCEQSAVMMDGTLNFPFVDDIQVCTPNVDCFPTKQNCNDTLTCSGLLALKADLSEGGHNILCRNEKTYWQMNAGEVKNCHVHANCMETAVKPTQRQLQPHGWASANAFADAFREMAIPIGEEFSSPFSRCAKHADVFTDAANQETTELLDMADWKEVLAEFDIVTPDEDTPAETIKMSEQNALKWQAYNLRNLAGKKPAAGTNNVMVTHGLNIKNAFGIAVDEGYCVVLKPSGDAGESLSDTIGTLTVANQEFEFDTDSFPVDAIARMSPESAIHMHTCHDVQQTVKRSESISKSFVKSLEYDADGDLSITAEEFTAAHPFNNSDVAFDFVKSIQPDVLGKSESASIELGQFFHMNWGWREFATSDGGIALPWRRILENTIGIGGDSVTERVKSFQHANAILSALLSALSDSTEYASQEDMEDKLLNCEPLPEAHAALLQECSFKTHLAGSGGKKYFAAGDAIDTESVYGIPLAYPADLEASFYSSKNLKVSMCLVQSGEIDISELLKNMGCSVPSEPLPHVPDCSDHGHGQGEGEGEGEGEDSDTASLVWSGVMVVVIVIICALTPNKRRKAAPEMTTV